MTDELTLAEVLDGTHAVGFRDGYKLAHERAEAKILALIRERDEAIRRGEDQFALWVKGDVERREAISARETAEAALSAAREEVARLKRALEPFAALGDVVLAEAPPNATRFDAFQDCQGVTHKLELDDFRCARATLTKEPTDV